MRTTASNAKAISVSKGGSSRRRSQVVAGGVWLVCRGQINHAPEWGSSMGGLTVSSRALRLNLRALTGMLLASIVVGALALASAPALPCPNSNP